MQRTSLLYLAAVLLAPSAAVFAQNPVKATSQITLKGRIAYGSNQPLADVRVGLRLNGAVTHTDKQGQFTLALNTGRPLARDGAKVYDYLEIDKDGYLGRTINIGSSESSVLCP